MPLADRHHVHALASRAMRHVVIDHRRRRQTQPRTSCDAGSVLTAFGPAEVGLRGTTGFAEVDKSRDASRGTPGLFSL